MYWIGTSLAPPNCRDIAKLLVAFWLCFSLTEMALAQKIAPSPEEVYLIIESSQDPSAITSNWEWWISEECNRAIDEKRNILRLFLESPGQVIYLKGFDLDSQTISISFQENPELRKFGELLRNLVLNYNHSDHWREIIQRDLLERGLSNAELNKFVENISGKNEYLKFERRVVSETALELYLRLKNGTKNLRAFNAMEHAIEDLAYSIPDEFGKVILHDFSSHGKRILASYVWEYNRGHSQYLWPYRQFKKMPDDLDELLDQKISSIFDALQGENP